jgi:hypothetical protein
VWRALAGCALVLMVAGCQGPEGATQKKPLTAQSVTLQAKDVPDMQRCDASGDLDAVLQRQQSSDPRSYEKNSYEWGLWKREGATEGYLAVYGASAVDCAALSSPSSGAPKGGLVLGLVIKFKNDAIATRIYETGAEFLGFGPNDLSFIKSTGGNVTTGSETGLGAKSAIGSATVPGATYFFAFWLNKSFQSDFLAYNVASGDAARAVRDMNGRIL